MDFVTALLVVSMTETVPDPLLVTYALVPSLLITTPVGWPASSIVETTVLVPVSITDTVLESRFVT